MQPTQAPRSAGENWSSTTTSLVPMRPRLEHEEGFSEHVRFVGRQGLTRQLGITTSTVSADRGMASIGPFKYVNWA